MELPTRDFVYRVTFTEERGEDLLLSIVTTSSDLRGTDWIGECVTDFVELVSTVLFCNGLSELFT